MKTKSTRVFALVLTLVMVLSAFFAVDVSAFAANVSSSVSESETDSTAPTEPTETQPATDSTESSEVPTEKPAPVVGKIEKVRKTEIEPGKIKLEWEKVENATGYYVYYKKASSTNEFAKIADIASNACAISNLNQDVQYQFMVSPYIEQDGVKYEGEGTIAKADGEPPTVGKIEELTISDINKGKVSLEWNIATEATGYYIYFKYANSTGDYVKIGDINATACTISNLKDTSQYEFMILPYAEQDGVKYEGEGKVVQTAKPVEPVEPEPPKPVIGKIDKVNKTSFETNEITLEWDKVSGATGYVVYIKNADVTNTYSKATEVNTNSCTIKNLEHTTQYHFMVAPYVLQDGVKYEGEGTLKKTATQAGQVTGLSLQRSSSIIQFRWDKNSKATGYRIYRASGATDGEYVLYKTITSNSTTQFQDTNVELGRAYYYSVRPYRDLYGTTYNAPHNVIRFICGMSGPDYSISSQVSRANLTWYKNKYAHGYDIYYATSRDGKYTLLDSTTNDYYNTPRLTNNKTYYFRVQPYKLNGGNKTKVVGSYATKEVKITNKAFGTSVGNTYIEISIKQQHIWYYRNGELYCHAPVVTGNDDGYHNTPRGVYTIWQRQSPTVLVGANYASPVDYWLAFNGGIGIHDSSWRSSGEYGGTTYQGNGSHGCVNTPYSTVAKIYEKARLGDYVVVY